MFSTRNPWSTLSHHSNIDLQRTFHGKAHIVQEGSRKPSSEVRRRKVARPRAALLLRLSFIMFAVFDCTVFSCSRKTSCMDSASSRCRSRKKTTAATTLRSSSAFAKTLPKLAWCGHNSLRFTFIFPSHHVRGSTPMRRTTVGRPNSPKTNASRQQAVSTLVGNGPFQTTHTPPGPVRHRRSAVAQAELLSQAG